MKFVCQLDYPHIPYPTETLKEQPNLESTVKSSGCGLCSACMIVDLLTDQEFTVKEAEALSEAVGGNRWVGTDMKSFGVAVAEKFNLNLERTSDLSEAIAHLQNGGKIITHVGTPKGASVGTFSKIGHYMVLVDTDGEYFTILDPSYKPGKYDIPERRDKVDVSHAPFLRASVQTLHEATREGRIKYHMFSRKTD